MISFLKLFLLSLFVLFSKFIGSHSLPTIRKLHTDNIEFDSTNNKLMGIKNCSDDVISNIKKKLSTKQKCKWKKDTVTYHIVYTKIGLTEDDIRTAIREAFDLWSPYTGIKFIELEQKDNADILIEFKYGEHKEGVLLLPAIAHTVFRCPGQGRTIFIHFNSHVGWRINAESNAVGEYDFLSVASHEVGHTLGLPDDTTNPQSVLYYAEPNNYQRPIQLTCEDIAAVSELYGYRTPEDRTDVLQLLNENQRLIRSYGRSRDH